MLSQARLFPKFELDSITNYIKKYLSEFSFGPAMDSATQSTYQDKLTRYVSINYNGIPDRIPLRILAEEFAAKYCGYTNYEVVINHELQFDINRKFALDPDIDAIQTNSVVN